MKTFTQTMSGALLALALAAAGLAQAGTRYHVDVDSTGYAGDGSLELTFLGLAGAAPAGATASGFTGDFGPDGGQEGSVTGAFPGPRVFTNAGTNDFWRAVTLGGVFGFDVDLDVPTAPGAGTTFAVYLAGASAYLTPDGSPVARFDLATGMAPAIATNPLFASVTPAAAVPEPASWALVAGGLTLLGGVRRRAGTAHGRT